MVNIHVFDLNETEKSSPRGEACLNETLQHQTDYSLFYWTLSNSEIKEIVENSRYCQAALSDKTLGPSFASVFQYVKMIILSRYGGWCVEIDEAIRGDLSKIDLDFSKSYLPRDSNDENFALLVAWQPCYVAKGLDVSQAVHLADNFFGEDYNPVESEICRIPVSPDILDLDPFINKIKCSHYQSPIFTNISLADRMRYDLNDKEQIQVSIINGYNQASTYTQIVDSWDIFIKCCKQFHTFDKVFPALDNPKKIILSEKFHNKIRTEIGVDFSMFTIEKKQINIHIFDLTKTLSSRLRDSLCVKYSLENQSNYNLKFWTLDDKEIQDIMSKSRYCQMVSTEIEPSERYNLYFQYLKMAILSKYGGFCFEADCYVTADLNNLNFDRNALYLHLEHGKTPCACAWYPIYVPTGVSFNETLQKADSYYADIKETCEVFFCEIIDNVQLPIYSNDIFKDVSLHFQKPFFCYRFKGGRYVFDETDEATSVSMEDYWNTNLTLTLNAKTDKEKEILWAAFAEYRTFSESFPALAENNTVWFSKRFYENHIKNNYNLQGHFSIFERF